MTDQELYDNYSKVIRAIPASDADSGAWIAFHKFLLREFSTILGSGREMANIIFLKAWEDRQNWDANDDTLRAYMSKQKVEIDPDMYDRATAFASDPFGIISTTSSITKWILPLIIILIVFLLVIIGRVLWSLSANPGNALMFSPAGRSMAILSALQNPTQ